MENITEIINLEALIEARDFNTLREATKNWPAGNLADLMEPLSAEKEAVAFRLLSREQAAAVFSYLSEERQTELLKAMAHEDVTNILNVMSDDDRTTLLEELPAKVTQQLLNLLSADERSIASQLLGYAEGSVGRLMTPHFVRIRPQWTISHALDHIRRYGVDSETMSVVYVIDDNDKLIDDLRIRQILLSSSELLVSDLMDSRFVSLKATDGADVAVEAIKEADLPALPVTDTQGMLIGIVTVDDILDVAEGEDAALDQPAHGRRSVPGFDHAVAGHGRAGVDSQHPHVTPSPPPSPRRQCRSWSGPSRHRPSLPAPRPA